MDSAGGTGAIEGALLNGAVVAVGTPPAKLRPIRRVNVDLTYGMPRELDERAARLSISRQAVLKTLLGRPLNEERESKPQPKKAGQAQAPTSPTRGPSRPTRILTPGLRALGAAWDGRPAAPALPLTYHSDFDITNSEYARPHKTTPDAGHPGLAPVRLARPGLPSGRRHVARELPQHGA